MYIYQITMLYIWSEYNLMSNITEFFYTVHIDICIHKAIKRCASKYFLIWKFCTSKDISRQEKENPESGERICKHVSDKIYVNAFLEFCIRVELVVAVV